MNCWYWWLVLFMSYRIPFKIHPIKRYSWKYEVEKRHKITRQWTRTHLRHKLDFQQQTHKLSIHLKENYDSLRSSCLHNTRDKLWPESLLPVQQISVYVSCTWRRTYFVYSGLLQERDTRVGIVIFITMKKLMKQNCYLQKKWQPRLPKQEWTNKQPRIDEMKKQRR